MLCLYFNLNMLHIYIKMKNLLFVEVSQSQIMMNLPLFTSSQNKLRQNLYSIVIYLMYVFNSGKMGRGGGYLIMYTKYF